jgi:dihydroorotase
MVLGFTGHGRIVPGGPADLTIFDTEHVWTYDVNHSASKSRNSPFHGHVFRGGPVATVVRGEFAWRAT